MSQPSMHGASKAEKCIGRRPSLARYIRRVVMPIELLTAKIEPQLNLCAGAKSARLNCLKVIRFL